VAAGENRQPFLIRIITAVQKGTSFTKDKNVKSFLPEYRIAM